MPEFLDMVFILNALQWPAMVATLFAAWLVGAENEAYRNKGFWCFILSNLLWVVWGWHSGAYALILLQAGLFLMNVRGAKKNSD